MFDLEREIAAWSAAVHGERCRTATSEAELRDHLCCEIERGRREGLSDEESFQAAVRRLGPAAELAAELGKNSSALETACRVLARGEGRRASTSHRHLLLSHAVVWAALVLASSLLVASSTAPDLLGYLLIAVYMPLWWASDQLLRRALRQRGATGL